MISSAPLPGRIGRNWHAVFLLALSLAHGVGGLVSGGRAEAIEAAFPAWAQYAWYAGLAAGSALGITGITLSTVTGLLVERAAMIALSGLCTAYVLGALVNSPLSAVANALGVGYVLAFALANAARVRQISLILSRIEGRLRTLRHDRGAGR